MSLNELQCKRCFHSRKINKQLYCRLMNDAHCKLYNVKNNCREYYKKTWFFGMLYCIVAVVLLIATSCILILLKGVLYYNGGATLTYFLKYSGVVSIALFLFIYVYYDLYKDIEKERAKYVDSLEKCN